MCVEAIVGKDNKEYIIEVKLTIDLLTAGVKRRTPSTSCRELASFYGEKSVTRLNVIAKRSWPSKLEDMTLVPFLSSPLLTILTSC